MPLLFILYLRRGDRWGWGSSSHAPRGPGRRAHLLGVIVEESDGAQLGSDAAGLGEGCAAVLVRSLFEFISDGNISDGRWSRLHVHLGEQSRVEQEAPDGEQQAHQEDEQQEQQQRVRHDDQLLFWGGGILFLHRSDNPERPSAGWHAHVHTQPRARTHGEPLVPPSEATSSPKKEKPTAYSILTPQWELYCFGCRNNPR